MKMLKKIIATLPEARIEEIRTCARWTAVLSDIGCGLASTLQNRCHCGQPERQVRDCGNLTQKPALELAKYALSENLLEASIGIATINSLIRVEENNVEKGDILQILRDKTENKNIAIIGHFPIVKKLRNSAAKVWVIEQNPTGEDLDEKQGAKVLPEADMVIITSTSLINGTLEGILAKCRKDSCKMLLGPSTPLSPVVFEYGIDMISGIKVVNAKLMLDCIGQGASFQQVRGVEKISVKKSS